MLQTCTRDRSQSRWLTASLEVLWSSIQLTFDNQIRNFKLLENVLSQVRTSQIFWFVIHRDTTSTNLSNTMSPKPLISPSWDVASFMDPLNQLCVKKMVCDIFACMFTVLLSIPLHTQHTNEKLCEVKQRLYIDSGDSVCVYTNTRCECVCVHTSMCVQTHPLYQLLLFIKLKVWGTEIHLMP